MPFQCLSILCPWSQLLPMLAPQLPLKSDWRFFCPQNHSNRHRRGSQTHALSVEMWKRRSVFRQKDPLTSHLRAKRGEGCGCRDGDPVTVGPMTVGTSETVAWPWESPCLFWWIPFLHGHAGSEPSLIAYWSERYSHGSYYKKQNVHVEIII